MDTNYELLTEKDAMWAQMLMQMLTDNAIACTALPTHGAGLTLKTGMPERLKIYVPGAQKAQAQELLAFFTEGNE